MNRIRKLDQWGFDHFVGLVVFVVLFALIGSFLLIKSHAAAWSGELQLGLDKKICLDNAGSKTTGGNTIDVYSCNGTAAQKWTITTVSGYTNRFTLKNGQGTCADDWGDAVGTSATNRVYLKTYTCNSSDHAQQWEWENSTLENVYSHGCINDPGNSETNGTALIIYGCNSKSSNELWYEAAQPAATTAPATDGCMNASVYAPCIGSATTGASGWGSPVFDDEFTGSTLNTTYWSPTWFNGSSSNNVVTSAANVAVTGGDLVLTLPSSTSGATVDTDPSQVSGGGFQFGDGYFAEARVYLPGSGSTIYNWPSFWTDGQNWPADGENDVVEGLGTATSNYHSTSGANLSGTIAGTWSNGWHTYAVDREAGENYIYWDGSLVRSYATDDAGAPHYLIFTLGCSSGCTTGTASQVKVDYVRVWKKQ